MESWTGLCELVGICLAKAGWNFEIVRISRLLSHLHVTGDGERSPGPNGPKYPRGGTEAE